MKRDVVKLCRTYMRRMTLRHKAPAWELTEIAVAKARELFKYYPKIDKKVVLCALYLAHVHFGTSSTEQHKHAFKSAVMAGHFLKKLKLKSVFVLEVVGAIEAHHGEKVAHTLEAEVMKNAEAFKFLTSRGALVMFAEGLKRGMDFDTAREYVLRKMEQKYKLVTLLRCKTEAKKNRRAIRILFSQ